MTGPTLGGGALRPLHAILLGFPVVLFTSALVTDIAYLRTAQIQWTNFSAWLIVGALVTGGLVGLWAIVDLILGWKGRARARRLFHVVALALAWLLGLVNAFQHSRDGWSSVGTAGLMLSILCTVLALIAAWIAFADAPAQEAAR